MKTKEQYTAKAHSKQQFDKWKSYLNGLHSDKDMYMIARNYINEIIGMCNAKGISRYKETDKTIFTHFAKCITI